MEIIKKQFKEHSHIPIEKIKEMQAKHKDDLVQPREGGEINPRYVELYGSKNINVTSHDVEYLAKKSHRLADVLDNQRRQRQGSRKYY
jgi:hypothetical protein